MAVEKVVDISLDDIDTVPFAQRHVLGKDGEWAVSVGTLSRSIALNGQSTAAYVVPKPGLKTQVDIDNFQKENVGLPAYDLVFGHRRYAAVSAVNAALKDKSDNEDLKAIREALKTRGVKGALKLKAVIHDRGSESNLWTIVVDENEERANFTPTETAEAEVKLKNVLSSEGVISTKDNADVSKPTFAEYRARQTGKSVRTIENTVALGEAPQTLRDAVDAKTISVGCAYKLATKPADVITNVVHYISTNSITIKSPAEITAIIDSVSGTQPTNPDGTASATVAPDAAALEAIKALEANLKTPASDDDGYTEVYTTAVKAIFNFYGDKSHYKGANAVKSDGGSLARMFLKATGAAAPKEDDEFGDAPKPEYTENPDGTITFQDGHIEDKDGNNLELDESGVPKQDEHGDFVVIPSTSDDETATE